MPTLDPLALLLTGALLLILSAALSGSEAAVFSLSSASRDDEPHPNRHLRFFSRRTPTLLATLLIANNLVNIGLVLLLTMTWGHLSAGWALSPVISTLVQLVIITGLLLLLGEVTPKLVAANR